MEELWGFPVELEEMKEDMGHLIGNDTGIIVDARQQISPSPSIHAPTPHGSRKVIVCICRRIRIRQVGSQMNNFNSSSNCGGKMSL
jgi:hypothetical protein